MAGKPSVHFSSNALVFRGSLRDIVLELDIGQGMLLQAVYFDAKKKGLDPLPVETLSDFVLFISILRGGMRVVWYQSESCKYCNASKA